VAVRIAMTVEDKAAARQEFEAYERMSDLQGTYVPRLKAFGYTLGGTACFVATEYLEVCSLPLRTACHALFGRCLAGRCTTSFGSTAQSAGCTVLCEATPAEPSTRGVNSRPSPTHSRCVQQGDRWDWESPAHLALGPRLLEALQKVHELKIRHGDVHEANILVTPEGGVFLLDFDACEWDAPDWALEDEQSWVEKTLSWKPWVRPHVLAPC